MNSQDPREPVKSMGWIKREAKRIKKETGIQHCRALDEAAKLAGFGSFHQARKALGDSGNE